MRIGVLTSGGDCPGLDAAIRAVARRLSGEYDFDVLGIKNGFKGLVEGDIEPLNRYSVSGILPKGGTILGTSRRTVEELRPDLPVIQGNIKRHEIDAIIVIGSVDEVAVSSMLFENGINTVCIPATIDNNIYGTERTFGFDTAVSIATDAIDRLHSTADSHNRVMVVELMGGSCGWIATMAGLAGGADCILIPEVDFSLQEVAELIKKRHLQKSFSIIVAAEGIKEMLSQTEKQLARSRFVADHIADYLEQKTGMEARTIILGHVQRGGSPTSYDRILATRYGVKAADMVAEKKFGSMAALKGTDIVDIPTIEVAGKVRRVDAGLYDLASVFFG